MWLDTSHILDSISQLKFIAFQIAIIPLMGHKLFQNAVGRVELSWWISKTSTHLRIEAEISWKYAITMYEICRKWYKPFLSKLLKKTYSVTFRNFYASAWVNRETKYLISGIHRSSILQRVFIRENRKQERIWSDVMIIGYYKAGNTIGTWKHKSLF